MTFDWPTIFPVLALGFIAGILSGMFGIGGGLVIVPALVFFFGISQKTATGTSMFALLWPVGLLGVAAYWRAGHMSLFHGAWIAVGLFLGAFLGAQLTLALPTITVKRIYAVFLVLVGLYYLYTTLVTPAAKELNPAAAPEMK